MKKNNKNFKILDCYWTPKVIMLLVKCIACGNVVKKRSDRRRIFCCEFEGDMLEIKAEDVDLDKWKKSQNQ